MYSDGPGGRSRGNEVVPGAPAAPGQRAARHVHLASYNVLAAAAAGELTPGEAQVATGMLRELMGRIEEAYRLFDEMEPLGPGKAGGVLTSLSRVTEG